MRVVLDTNSLLVSIGRKSRFRPIFDALIAGQYTLLVTTEILLEYSEIIEQKTSILIATRIHDFLKQSPDVEQVDVNFKWSIIYQDQDDNKFVDCGLNGNADLLVTDDRHFSVLNNLPFPPLRVMHTRDFVAHLGQNP